MFFILLDMYYARSVITLKSTWLYYRLFAGIMRHHGVRQLAPTQTTRQLMYVHQNSARSVHNNAIILPSLLARCAGVSLSRSQ